METSTENLYVDSRVKTRAGIVIVNLGQNQFNQAGSGNSRLHVLKRVNCSL